VLRSPGARFTAAVFVIELAVRLAVIQAHPENFSMDAYQRWGGREHLLVQDWLPATQFFVWATAALGGGIMTMRIVMAIVGALAVTAGAWVARYIGGPPAGWLFIPIGLFGPFLTWSVVPYQEGTFFLALFGGLALALHAAAKERPANDRLWIVADMVAGLLPLVRYEGWPVTLLYILWRQQPRACLAAWGAALWLLLKLSDVHGHAASPISYADWEGLDVRFESKILLASLSKLWTHMLDTKGVVLLITGIAAWVHLFRAKRPWVIWLGLVFAGQLAALAGWIVGLETATYRMQAVPGVLLGLFVACSAGLLWHKVRRPGQAIFVLVGAAASVLFTLQAIDNAKRSTRAVRWESRLVQSMEECPECRYLIKPRRGIGTRDRHDGCEIIQGLGMDLHGERFWCQKWGQTPDDFKATHAARWRKGGYVIRDARKADRRKR
jgi:hypothetical protein